MTTRNNLLPDSSFRTLLPWESVKAATFSKHTTDAVQGGVSLRVRLSDEEGSGFRSGVLPITSLRPYAASIYARVPSAPSSVGAAVLVLQLVWRNQAGAIVSTSSSAQRTLRVTDDWLRLSLVATAPASATTVQYQVLDARPSPAYSPQYFLVDAALLEQSSFVGGWIDTTSSDDKTTVLNRALTKPSAHPTEGLPLRADVVLDDLVLNTIDEDDTLWVCTDIDGWWGHSAPEFPAVPRGTDDGDFDMSGRYEARIITIKGTFFPTSVAQLQRARDRLVSATNLVRRGAWFRTNEDPTKGAFVRLSGKPLIETVNARGRTDFSISLKAADPIRYGWNDNDIEGYTTILIPQGGEASAMVNNQGTASVRGIIEMTGPLGSGSTIANARTGERLRLLKPLRGANLIASITQGMVWNKKAYLYVREAADLYEGDLITVLGAGYPYDTGDTPAVVTSVSNTSPPYAIVYEIDAPDSPLTYMGDVAAVRLAYNDVLSIDTYEKSVTFNGTSIGNRSRIDTLVDWIQLMPGDNELSVYDTRTDLRLTRRGWNADRGGFIETEGSHYLNLNDQVTVDIPVSVNMTTKSLTNNIATITTEEPHGFIPGEKISVFSTAVSNVVEKTVVANNVTLTTEVAGQFGTDDQITIELPSAAVISAKAASGTEVTLTTTQPHKFSNGDTITVALPTTARAASRSRVNNVATMETESQHNFSVGDRVSISLPSTATISTKSISSATITLTTTVAHGFTAGSSIVLSFPTTATPTGARNTTGGNALTATLTTTAAHGFDIGDRITVNVGVEPVRSVTNRVATTTAVTLTCGTHNFAVGERVQVSNMGARYDGVHTITAVTATTITYAFAGATVASGAATGTVTNLTIRDGYNGTKIIDAVTSTTITYFAGLTAQSDSAGSGGTGASIVNNTNQIITGTRKIASVGSPTQMTFNRSV